MSDAIVHRRNSPAPASTDGWQRPAVLVAAGSLAVALGLLVYAADRPAGHALLIPAFPAFMGGRLFGTLGQWLPSFVHPFAFSLFTAAALPSRATPRYAACVAWCAVNVAFEVGQHRQISAHLATVVHDFFGQSSPARALANYFVRGTFDIGDIVAAVLGALAAAAVLRLAQSIMEKSHAT